MRIEEARFLADRLQRFSAETISPCLNMGSSTREFREVAKPHIAADFIRPLERHGIRFVHADMKPGDGIDIIGDLFDPAVQEKLTHVGVKSLLLTNVLEHVTDRKALAELCLSLLPPGGLLVVTVPYSYPYHADPIDTLYRPTPQEIANVFQGAELLDGAIIEAGSAWGDLMSGGRLALVRYALRLMLPFLRPRVWVQHVHRLFWFARPYLVSVAILRKSLTT